MRRAMLIVAISVWIASILGISAMLYKRDTCCVEIVKQYISEPVLSPHEYTLDDILKGKLPIVDLPQRYKYHGLIPPEEMNKAQMKFWNDNFPGAER